MAWAIHLKPLPGECLSSWASRIAHAHGHRAHTFYRLTLGQTSFFQNDIDRTGHHDLLKFLINNTKTDPFIAHQTYFKSYAKNLCPEISKNGKTLDLLSLDIRAQRRRGFGQQFCPKCLASDPEPYFRILWRFTALPICLKHRIILVDNCPHCSMPINPFHILPLMSDVSQCSHCFSKIYDIKPVNANEKVIELCKSIYLGIQNSWITHKKIDLVMSPLFLKGIWRVVSLLYRSSFGNKLIEKINTIYLLNIDLQANSIISERVFQRYQIIMFVSELLSNWPNNFIKFCKECSITSSKINSHNRISPFWMDKVIQKELFEQLYWTNLKEFKSVLLYLKRRNTPLTRKNITDLLGNDESMTFTLAHKNLIKIIGEQ